MAWNGRYPLILNPSARSERAQRARNVVMDNAADFVIYASKNAEDAGNLATHFAEKKEPIVVAAGGDGTMNTVVRGLAGSDTALGLLPTGTMNVFARELGVPSADLKLAMEIIKEGHVKEVDLFQVNDMPFVQMAGIGFDARIIEETSGDSKKLLGPLAYGLGAAKILGENPPKMTIELDCGRKTEGVCVLIGNGGLYGGQFKLFGKADNTDGLMDVLILQEQGYQMLLDFLKGLSQNPNQGIQTGEGKLQYVQTASMKVTTEQPVPLEVDGEYAGRASSFHFVDPHESKLKVISPKYSVVNEWQEALSALTPFMPWGGG